MKSTKTAAAAALLVAAMLTVTACSDNSNTTNEAKNAASTNTQTNENAPKKAVEEQPADPLGAYAEALTISTIAETNPEDKFPEGDSYEDNAYKRFLEKTLNVKVNYKWTAPVGDSYNNKFNLMIQSNDLPDVFVVRAQGSTPAKVFLNRLAENGMLEDLSSVYESYAAEGVKDVYNSTNGEALKEATYDGKLLALPLVGETDSAAPVIWVRQDWLDKLKLPAPTTLADLETVAKAFMEQDPNGNGKPDEVGLPTSGKEMLSDGQPMGLDTFFWNEKSYPKYWVEGADGALVYGGVQPETKVALGKLAAMYKAKIIDKEFALRDRNMASENLIGGTAGLMLGQWWAPFWPLGDAMKSDANSNWKAYTLKDAEGITKAGSSYQTQGYLVVRKGYEHPEVILKAMNIIDKSSSGEYEEINQLDMGTYKDGFKRDVYGIGGDIGYKDTVMRTVKKFREIMAGKAGKDLLDPEETKIYEQIERDTAAPKKDMNDYIQKVAWLDGIGAIADAKLDMQFNKFGDSTPTMDQKWTSLNDLQTQAFLKIIMGKEQVDYFDTFVKDWMAKGGEQITKEVNEKYASMK
ncbi:type 2 periplasmic-binding domain-containing protein [Paenibacillus swuensis]|nr:extracellular solute-binding protein [Paenibacillus swuensis]